MSPTIFAQIFSQYNTTAKFQCRLSCRAHLEDHWNLAVVLYCENICAKIVGDVKIAPYSQRPMFVQGEGRFSLRIKQFKA